MPELIKHVFPGHGEFYFGDCRELLATLPDKSIDLVLTDPPYFRVVSNEWDRQWPDIFAFQKWVGKIGVELKRVTKDNASIYWFGDDKTVAYCQTELDKYFSLINSLVWHKTNPNVKGIMTYRSYGITTERILFYEHKNATGLPAAGLEAIHSRPDFFQSIKKYMRAERAKLMEAMGFTIKKQCSNYLTELLGHTAHRHYFDDSQFEFLNAENYAKLQKSGFFGREYEDLRREYEDLRREYEDLRRVWHPDLNAREVLTFNNPATEHHPTQKPLELIAYLLDRSSKNGMTVLDPFAGSGTTAIAAIRQGCRFICCEKDRAYFDAAVARIQRETAQLRLPL